MEEKIKIVKEIVIEVLKNNKKSTATLERNLLGIINNAGIKKEIAKKILEECKNEIRKGEKNDEKL